MGTTEGHIFIRAQAMCTSLSNAGTFLPFSVIKKSIGKVWSKKEHFYINFLLHA